MYPLREICINWSRKMAGRPYKSNAKPSFRDQFWRLDKWAPTQIQWNVSCQKISSESCIL